MISETKFNGGAKYSTITTDTSVVWGSGRVQKFKNTSGTTKVITLPSPSMFSQAGGPAWFIINDPASTGSITVKYYALISDAITLMTLGTIAAGHAGVVLAANVTPGTESYVMLPRTTGVPRTSNTTTRPAIEAASVRASAVPLDCFDGDECGLADSLGNAPLDGTSGHPEVVAPLFFNSAESVNSKREAIRAADFVMPRVVVVKFADGEFAIDPLHPHGGAELSDEFYATLYNNRRPHGLTYVSAISGRSDHHHHARNVGSGVGPFAWEMKTGGLSVTRHLWQKTATYGPADDPAKYTMDIRFVMEHTVSGSPRASCSGGGVNDPDYGSWGAIFMVYVFTNEVDFGSADPITYTPTGSSSAISFSRSNPIRWGSCDGLTEGDDARFAHPQLAIAACLPTTMEAPAGTNYVPAIDRALSAEGTTLRNRPACYEVGNGSPWCTINSSPNPISRDYGIKYNVVFGQDSCGCMTTGGGTTSKPTEYVCIENGLGVGRTLLVPARAGWKEAEGVLDVATGSSIKLNLCTTDTWPSCELNKCMGHSDEPLDGVGGTPLCFNNNGSSTGTQCCVSIVDADTGTPNSAYSTLTEACAHMTNPGFDNNCMPNKAQECSSRNMVTKAELDFEDFDYTVSFPDSRVISWVCYRPNKDHHLSNYSYNSTDVAGMSNDIGSWTLGVSSITPASFAGSGSGAVRVMIRYNPVSRGWSWYGCEQTISATKIQQGSHGIGVGRDNGSNQFSGYAGVTKHTGTNQITAYIIKYKNGVASTLSSVVISTTQTSSVLKFRQHGTDFTFTVTPASSSDTVLTAEDCEFIDGGSYPCLITEDTSGTNVQFGANWEITDLVPDLVDVSATLEQSQASCDWDPIASDHYGDCALSHTIVCNGSLSGPTTVTDWFELVTSVYTTATVGGHDIIMPHCPTTDGENPTISNGPLPYCPCDWLPCTYPPVPACDTCPPPFLAINLQLPNSCQSDEDAVGEGRVCKGLALWHYAPYVCV